jgi:hypothetical protein
MDEKQEVLRTTNEEIRRLTAHMGADDGHFVCECGQHGCLELISLTLEEFDTLCARAGGMPLVAKSHR